MSATAVLQERTGKDATTQPVPHTISVGLAVLWIVGVAAAWNVMFVLFHNLMARLLR
jgi:beta-lactamase regulating signal transducer with metallopeptidase domain